MRSPMKYRQKIPEHQYKWYSSCRKILLECLDSILPEFFTPNISKYTESILATCSYHTLPVPF